MTLVQWERRDFYMFCDNQSLVQYYSFLHMAACMSTQHIKQIKWKGWEDYDDNDNDDSDGEEEDDDDEERGGEEEG